MRIQSVVALLGYALVSFALAPAVPSARAAADPCSTQTVHGNRYVICKIDMAKTAVLVGWRGNSGEPFGSLGAVEREVAANGDKLVFVMNGGMYHEDLSPIGYHVENREKFKNANTRPGPGNFHLLPNGIFYVDGKRAGVMETRAFLRRNKRPQFATQSGPMLVINGKMHPKFRHNSQSRKVRNGAGVSRDGRTAYFVLSDEPVTFYAFAKVFQRHLKTPNALFLDGSVSQLASRTISRHGFRPVGPVIVGVQR